ncbi:hypothetical protein DFH09DRAFT_1324526 [Mycena vulgaris]|nr:hypothetical protein DFH09DRAFT_1324526 [Mycena vulgaris]
MRPHIAAVPVRGHAEKLGRIYNDKPSNAQSANHCLASLVPSPRLRDATPNLHAEKVKMTEHSAIEYAPEILNVRLKRLPTTPIISARRTLHDLSSLDNFYILKHGHRRPSLTSCGARHANRRTGDISRRSHANPDGHAGRDTGHCDVPVLKLPFEITANIFFQILPPLSHVDEEWLTSPLLVLLGVCRTWRDIALATPTLWLRLSIEFNLLPANVTSQPGLVESFIDLWLGRAGGRPLSICFVVGQYEDEDKPGRLRTILQISRAPA